MRDKVVSALFVGLAAAGALGAAHFVGYLACRLMLPGVDVEAELARASWWGSAGRAAVMLGVMGLGAGLLHFARVFVKVARGEG